MSCNKGIKFLYEYSNPYSTSNDDKILYKTEDLAYYNENNDIVYHSRKDFIYYFTTG
jgi:hypothetical protein